MIASLDATGAEHIADLDRRLRDRSITLCLARVHHRVRTQIDRSHLGPLLDGRIYGEVEDALATTEQ